MLMSIPVFTATGSKKGTLDLPSVFTGKINKALMHQALVMQQSNRRAPIAHVKTRGEVVGSTKKLFQQKGTGRARRGPVRSPLLRGGGKIFGPRNTVNFTKDMPKAMRRAAIASCLAWQAKREAIIALENYGEETKTKTFVTLLKKLPVELGRRILVVADGSHRGLVLSGRNVPGVTILDCNYLNVEDIAGARHVIFLSDAINKVQEMLTKERKQGTEEPMNRGTEEQMSEPKVKKPAAKKTIKKASSKKSS